MNYAIFGVFTVCESFLVANVTAFYDPVTILIAAIMTLAVTCGITAYACLTKHDFTSWYGVLFGMLVGGIFFAIFMGVFYRSRSTEILMSLVFIAIYSCYIVVDT